MSYTDEELTIIGRKSVSDATPAEAAQVVAYINQFTEGVRFRASAGFMLSSLRKVSGGGMTAYESFGIPVTPGTVLTCFGVDWLRFGDGSVGITWGNADGKRFGEDCMLSSNDTWALTGVPRPGLLEIVE